MVNEIDRILADDATRKKSLRDDWALCEGAVGIAPFLRITAADIEAAMDPDFFDPQKKGTLLVKGTPEGIDKAKQLDAITVVCPICRPRKIWSDNLVSRRRRLLDRIHATKISDYESSDPLEGVSVKDTYNAVKGCFEDVEKFGCEHGHGQFYAILSEDKKTELLRNVDRLIAYRRQLRRVLAEITGAQAKHEAAPSLTVSDPDATIKKFQERQKELQQKIADGDRNIRELYAALGREDFEVSLGPQFFTNNNAVSSVTVTSEATSKLRGPVEQWRIERRDLQSRIMQEV